MKNAYVVEVDAGYANPKRIALSRENAIAAAIDLCADIIPEFRVKESAWKGNGQKLKGKDGTPDARLYIYGLPLFDEPPQAEIFDAMRELLDEVDNMANRVGWAGYGARDKARTLLAKLESAA